MQSKTQKQWREGPTSSIPLMPCHDRPVFCMAVQGDNVVTGSADHGLREYDLQTTKHIRELFGKKYGHKEWVSTCAYSKSGKVLSGGMDFMVCLWDAKGVRCDHFAGHSGSISKVLAEGDIGMSASYDTSIILWDFKHKKEATKLYGTHKDAVMDLAWHQSLLVSGDKSGTLAIWDLNASQTIKAIKTHKGAVSGIQLHSNHTDSVFVSTGLNDGQLVVHDMRTHKAVFAQMIHKGAINGLSVQDDLIVTASADGKLEMIHFPSMKRVHSIDAGDMLLCMQKVGRLTVGGTAKGNILVYDDVSGQCLYGYGVMKKGGCRCLGVNDRKDRLVCAGEDDNAIVLTF